MRIIIKNARGTRELIVKVQYDLTEVKKDCRTDEYGRYVCYYWTEKVTTVKCHEYGPDSIPTSRSVFIGNAICDYRDSKRFSKVKGRSIAWTNCIVEMFDKGFVTQEEALALYIGGITGTIVEIDMTGDKVKISRKI